MVLRTDYMAALGLSCPVIRGGQWTLDNIPLRQRQAGPIAYYKCASARTRRILREPYR